MVFFGGDDLWKGAGSASFTRKGIPQQSAGRSKFAWVKETDRRPETRRHGNPKKDPLFLLVVAWSWAERLAGRASFDVDDIFSKVQKQAASF